MQTEQFMITDPRERELALIVLRLPEQIDLAVNDLQINRICDHVYDLATKIGQYHHDVRVIGTPEEASRILLLETTRRVMAQSFNLLGMKTIEKI